MKKIDEILDMDWYKKLFLTLLSLPKDQEQIIINSFENYKKNKLTLEKLIPTVIDSNVSDKMINCFDKSPKPIEIINYKNDLKSKNNIQICPYCWVERLDEYYPIEHYLPKRHFSEYTLFGLNLFICCTKCNSYLKNDKWEEWNRLFLNPYIDELYNKEFLWLNIEEQENKLYKFSVTLIKRNFNSQELTLLENHFNSFKLISRLDLLIPNIIDEFIIDIEDYINDEILPNELNKEYKKNLKKYGINSLRTVITKYFSENIEILKKIYEYK